MTFSRNDYIERKCTHRQYYAQFVDGDLLMFVRSRFLKHIEASRDESFNDIPLADWDFAGLCLDYETIRVLRLQLAKCNDYLTQAGIVCILKEAAEQIRDARRILSHLLETNYEIENQ